MNIKTRAMWETLKPGLPYAWVPVLFAWTVWTLATDMIGQTPIVINFLVSSLLSIVLTVVAVFVQYCVGCAVRSVLEHYRNRLRVLEDKQRQQEIDRRTAEMFPTEQEIEDSVK